LHRRRPPDQVTDRGTTAVVDHGDDELRALEAYLDRKPPFDN
jgi:hypothetical protein